MFGDFSRFENDPELGLNGIYLSQGSPILDSHWNEQVAALTDWITALGQLATGDQFMRVGFTLSDNNNSISPGIAILGGRIAQSQSKISTSDDNGNRKEAPRVYFEAAADTGGPYLSLVSRYLPARMAWKQSLYRGSEVVEVTDWGIYYTNAGGGIPDVRTVGDGQSLVPRMMLQDTFHKSVFPAGCTTAVIEFHDRRQGGVVRYKLAFSPYNILSLEMPTDSEKQTWLKKGYQIVVKAGDCPVLDMTPDGEVLVEYEDDKQAHVRSVRTLHPSNDNNSTVVELILGAKLVPATITHREGEITLTLQEELLDASSPSSRPILRIWNQWPEVVGANSVVDKCLAGGSLVDVTDGVGATYLIAGDRWYLPVKNGSVQIIDKQRLPGHRVFRGLAKLGANTGGTNNDIAKSNQQIAKPPAASIEPQPMSVAHVASPFAHRLDDSLHRLTGALNAARSLTRHTPCKELKTRVSYLPLRRWLASAYVHEIVDLDLDRFLAKVRRSIDVLPEDEPRFREQAALILEEANQLAGRLPSPRGSTGLDPFSLADTTPPTASPFALGGQSRETLQRAFVQATPSPESPRA